MTRNKLDGPLVSVLTPFHNTASYLGESIESVLDQSYDNFDYILVDNQSDDGSTEIAEKYARADERIRLLRTDRLLSQGENYSFALSNIDPDAKYCKIVQADDWIYPQCLTEMVALGQANPSVGLISSYRIEGESVVGDGLPVDRSILNGDETARLHLLKGPIFLFGTQTTVMYRADLVRARTPFYRHDRYHFDTDVAYELLALSDFGFVHQVLSYTRVDPQSTFGRETPFNPRELDFLLIVLRHGRRFLGAADYHNVVGEAWRRYYRSFASALVRNAMHGRTKEFWRYHRAGLRTVGASIEPVRVLGGVGRTAADALGNPMQTITAWRRWRTA